MNNETILDYVEEVKKETDMIMKEGLTNLYEETIRCLTNNGKTIVGIEYILLDDLKISGVENIFNFFDALKMANIYYDSGYGTNEIPMSFVIVGDDWWMDRSEYDGQEWWCFNSKPDREKETTSEELFESLVKQIKETQSYKIPEDDED